MASRGGASRGQGNKGQRRNAGLIERDLEIYKCHMRGESVRAIGEKFGLRSSCSVWKAIGRGKEHVKKEGIDVEESRITIHQMFEETMVAAMAQLREQREEGVVTRMMDADGNKSIRQQKGADVRLIGEIGRSAIRWGEFLGITDRAPEQNVQATTVVLSAPTAGADFESRYGGQALQPSADQQTIDTAAVPVKETVVSEGGPGWGEPDAAA